MRKFAFSLVALLAVTFASLTPWLPEVKELQAVPFYDKWTHFIMYCGLSVCLQIDLLWRSRTMQDRGYLRSFVVFFVGPALWGALMEVCQEHFTSYRSGDWLDGVANMVGAALGYLIACFSSAKLNVKKE